jgi:hypothetical protein
MEREIHAPSNGLKAVDTLQKVLTEIGWKPQRDEETAGFVVDFDPPYIPVSTAFAAISLELEQFMFFVNFGVTASPEQRDAVCRFITRANWRLTVGNFEMDHDDGHVRVKSSVDFRGVELSEALIRNAIRAAMNAVEVYADSLIEVLAHGKDAEQAIKEAQRKRS